MAAKADYIAHAFLGNSKDEMKLMKQFPSAEFEGIVGLNAFDSCRNFILLQLDTFDIGVMRFTGPDEDNPKPLWFGAFNHPVRGRCKVAGGYERLDAVLDEEKRRADLPIYSPNQLYAMTPVTVEKTDILRKLIEHWLKEPFNLEYVMYEDSWSEFEKAVEAAGKIEIRNLAHIGMGSDESWLLATLWFEGKPLAVLTYQGEDWDYKAFVSHPMVLRDMIDWVYTLAPRPAPGEPGLVDPDTPNECYTEFWGHTIHEFYDVASGLPKRPPRHGKHDAWGHYGFWGNDVKYAEKVSD